MTGDTDWMQPEIMRLIKGCMVSIVLHGALVWSLSHMCVCERFMGVSLLVELKGRSTGGKKH